MRNELLDNYSSYTYPATERHNVSTNGHHEPAGKPAALPEILCITSYPPRQCGIATYSQDLIRALENKFGTSFTIKVCALETDFEHHRYGEQVHSTFNTSNPSRYAEVAASINQNKNLAAVLIQHEFGFFNEHESDFESFLFAVTKPIILSFHTVFPYPDSTILKKVRGMIAACESVIVMTNTSASILIETYGTAPEKITVIPHGTHLVPHLDKEFLKEKFNMQGRNILSTFGLLSAGKGIETTLEALPAIIEAHPDTLFLIIGKTHPTIVQQEGEQYRMMLQAKIDKLSLGNHVQFINRYLPLPDLLEYLQLTDMYLFTSKDPNQAVSGTFSYAISCGCAVVSTPIPHAREVLLSDAGIIIDFDSPRQLSQAVVSLLGDENLRKNFSSNGLHRMAPTAWENSAIAHAGVFAAVGAREIVLQYSMPETNLRHLKKLTTGIGMIQFSRLNVPDITSGYTLDDNARALVAMCQQYELVRDEATLEYISIYLNFIKRCLQVEGYFLNYVDDDGNFTEQNNSINVADSNGRALWALGYMISLGALLPDEMVREAEMLMQRGLVHASNIHSPRAMAFIIKGLYYYNSKNYSVRNICLLKELADRLVQMYRHESDVNGGDWQWYEGYLTYANSILPEAMLCAWLVTGNLCYKDIAKSTFDFLLSKIFTHDRITVISNKNWHYRDDELTHFIPLGGQQPIDVAYTILALKKFYDVFHDEDYRGKMEIAFNWFLGANHLQQIIYNPCTGGCYDGLEERGVNLNQGAESTVSYLMAKLAVEKAFRGNKSITEKKEKYLKINNFTQFA
jgi:glycosyltransferase involved in cell wall biosynthesis